MPIDFVESDLAGHDFIGTGFGRLRDASQSRRPTWSGSAQCGMRSTAARAFCFAALRKDLILGESGDDGVHANSQKIALGPQGLGV